MPLAAATQSLKTVVINVYVPYHRASVWTCAHKSLNIQLDIVYFHFCCRMAPRHHLSWAGERFQHLIGKCHHRWNPQPNVCPSNREIYSHLTYSVSEPAAHQTGEEAAGVSAYCRNYYSKPIHSVLHSVLITHLRCTSALKSRPRALILIIMRWFKTMDKFSIKRKAFFFFKFLLPGFRLRRGCIHCSSAVSDKLCVGEFIFLLNGRTFSQSSYRNLIMFRLQKDAALFVKVSNISKFYGKNHWT